MLLEHRHSCWSGRWDDIDRIGGRGLGVLGILLRAGGWVVRDLRTIVEIARWLCAIGGEVCKLRRLFNLHYIGSE